MAYKATFFVSTGRCGTQWLYRNLGAAYRRQAKVRHEVCADGYVAGRCFHAFHEGSANPLGDAFERHMKNVARIIKESPYVEIGWPCYGAVPFIVKQLGAESVRLVHLFRSPMQCTRSLDSHRIYQDRPRMKPRLLFPGMSGLVQKSIDAERWGRISHIEKCLFFWTELNAFALRLKADFEHVEWFDLRFEDIFSERNGSASMTELLRFMELPPASEICDRVSEREDGYVRKKRDDFKRRWLEIDGTPEFVEVARALGYASTSEGNRSRDKASAIGRWMREALCRY